MWTVEKRTQENSLCNKEVLSIEDNKTENWKHEDYVNASHKTSGTDHHSVRSSIIISRHYHNQHKIEGECEEKIGHHSNGIGSELHLGGNRSADRVHQERNDVVSTGNDLLVNGEREHSDKLCCQSEDVEEKCIKDSCDDLANGNVQHQEFHHPRSISEPLFSTSELYGNVLNDQECFDHGGNDLKDRNETEDDDDDDLEENQLGSGGDQNVDPDTRIGLVGNEHDRGDWNCLEGPFMANGTTTNGADFEYESQDEDVELSESER